MKPPTARASSGRLFRVVTCHGRVPWANSFAPAARVLLRTCFATVLAATVGCGGIPGVVLPNESTQPVDSTGFELLARFVHITDTHIVDEESPGRLTAAASLSRSAYRPYEAYSTQLLDGIVRTVNKMHVARQTIDFVIHTGDATDNAQHNELEWFVTILNGGSVDPLTGPDDRDPDMLPDPLLDPHHPFVAQGLYRHGVHGPESTIAWYSVLGNHDRFAVGVFPIVTDLLGRRVSPLPLEERIAFTFPVELDPTGSLSWGPITPANPGPPPNINFPILVQANPARRYITDGDFVETHLDSVGLPTGHGFDAEQPQRTWYSVSPAVGLRLIGLNSATPLFEQPALAYQGGAISLAQRQFLLRELAEAQERGEYVIVATHHPSDALEPVYGTSLIPSSFRRLLNQYPCVKLHLAGHWHRNVVIDRGGYLEIVTCSTLDAPQQGRVIEIWRPNEPRASARAAVRRLVEPRASARADARRQVQPQAFPARRDADYPVQAAQMVRQDAPDLSRPETQLDVQIHYRMFWHLDEIDAPDDLHIELFEDPLWDMRRIAADSAGAGTVQN